MKNIKHDMPRLDELLNLYEFMAISNRIFYLIQRVGAKFPFDLENAENRYKMLVFQNKFAYNS